MAMTSDQAREVREQLLPWDRRRVEVEGTVTRIGKYWDPRSRADAPSVCVANLEVREGDHPVIDHVWVVYAGVMINAGVREGDTVRFTAQAYRYQHRDPEDHNQVTERMGLREPRDVKCLNRALVIPAAAPEEATTVSDVVRERFGRGVGAVEVPPARESVVTPALVEAAHSPEPTPPPAPKADPRRELFTALLDLCDKHGVDKVRKTLAAVEALTEGGGP